MDGFKAYKYFMAVKLHFTTEKYDVFEKNGRVTGSRETFNRRNDKGIFEKLSRKFTNDQEYIQFLVANFAYGHQNVVYSIESDDYYSLWVKRKESMSRVFQVDLDTITRYMEDYNASFEDLYTIENGNPPLLNMYLGGHITLETMVILQDFDDYLSKWEPLIMLWHDHFLVIRKVKRFVKYDKSKVEMLYNKMKENLAEI